jgi:hypothetical protein
VSIQIIAAIIPFAVARSVYFLFIDVKYIAIRFAQAAKMPGIFVKAAHLLIKTGKVYTSLYILL